MERRIAVVTGGGGGIGAACARTLAADGWKTVVVDLDQDRACAVAGELDEKAYALDVGDAAAVKHLAERIESEVGAVTGLVACAGIIPKPYRAEAEPLDHWDQMMRVNLRGATLHAWLSAPLCSNAAKVQSLPSVRSPAWELSR
jgi:NAD(P)-dependent dehydrogenase (short-subunit alcohol dehydrogenase family)